MLPGEYNVELSDPERDGNFCCIIINQESKNVVFRCDKGQRWHCCAMFGITTKIDLIAFDLLRKNNKKPFRLRAATRTDRLPPFRCYAGDLLPADVSTYKSIRFDFVRFL